METKITKKIIAILAVIMLFTSLKVQQPINKNATPPKQPTKEEQSLQQQKDECEALKKWYDEGSIVIEGHVMESKWIETSDNDAGYYCYKIKINKLFKGKLNARYFNLFLRRKKVMITADVGSNCTDIIGWTGKIRPTKLTKEGYTTENKGVYATEGTKALGLEDEGFYKNFYNCCGIKENTSTEEKKVS